MAWVGDGALWSASWASSRLRVALQQGLGCVSIELEWLQVRALWFGSATGRFYIGPNLRYCLPYLNIETVG